jgi:L-lactate utilization protein LutC
MSGERETFLNRIRQAVVEGNRAGAVSPLPVRGSVGYQGAGGDSVGRFCTELAAAGGVAHVVTGGDAAREAVLTVIREKVARRVLLGHGTVLDTLALGKALTVLGIESLDVSALAGTAEREAFFGADVGVSGVDYLIAETGSLALLTRPDQPRSLSLLPPIHIAVAHRAQLLPDLFDLFEARWPERQRLPSCLSLITGPSKTGDIELRLVTGVHGPAEVHVVLIDEGTVDQSPRPT